MLSFLLRLLHLLKQLQYKHAIELTASKERCLQTIVKVYKQQHIRVYGNQTQIKDCIVYISKPYIRPIVRGKETKPTEFGVKVNKLLIDGLSFIEHFSFDVLYEGNRYE